jgi:hypothetical protein
MRRYRTTILSVLSLATIVAVVFILGLLLGAWDVGGSDGGSPGTGPSTEVSREREGVKMTLSVDKEVYGPGDSVNVSLEIENTTNAAVDYRGMTANKAGLTLLVSSGLAYPKSLLEPTADDLSGTLAGGARIQRQARWDMIIQMELTPITAPPGRYTIDAAFLVAREGFADLAELGAAVSFEVAGTGYVQPPLDALRAVIAADEVKAWGEARGDFIVCAYPPHGYFYNGSFSAGTGAETFDFLYTQQLENGGPICGIGTDGDAWRFVLFSANGEEPHRLTVHVALDEPVVQSITEGGPTPAPTP